MKKFLPNCGALSSDFLHTKCRNTTVPYLKSDVYRKSIPNEKVKWEIPFPDYQPTDYTSENLKGKSYADEEDPSNCKFNSEQDNGINRKSFICDYSLDKNGRPLNPIGRTGLCGRGTLGRWGPNHAADPIVSRFFKGELQFVGIQRKDNGEWAIPGGMVDRGETAQQASIREFIEEALDGNASSELMEFFLNKGEIIHRGYVDDPRNTDNAWMESTVINFHDSEDVLKDIRLRAGDDAGKVDWITIGPQMAPLYASHEDFIKILVKLHNVQI